MSSKRKCIECGNILNYVLPRIVCDENYEEAKRCLDLAKREIICGITMETMSIETEQSCIDFRMRRREDIVAYKNICNARIEELERKIETYERAKHGFADCDADSLVGYGL